MFNQTAQKEDEMQNATVKDQEEKLGSYAASKIHEGEEKVRKIASEVEHRLKQGEEQVRQLINKADKQLHEKPWPIVAGVAISCLFVGFLMGATKKGN